MDLRVNLLSKLEIFYTLSNNIGKVNEKMRDWVEKDMPDRKLKIKVS
jgi:hypothetical protein